MLLRLITKESNIKIGFCWMLTEPDDRTDGNRLDYFHQAEKYSKYDPPLYDFLNDCVMVRHSRNIHEIEKKRLLPGCTFFSEPLQDGRQEREEYSRDFKSLAKASDLLFFDTDNGVEVSIPVGRKYSSKYLYWNEIEELSSTGKSLLIFQYHRHVKYDDFLKELHSDFESKTGVTPFCYYRTSFATMILALQDKLTPDFSRINNVIREKWQEEFTVIMGDSL